MTWFSGRWIGQDSFGNHYYEQKRIPSQGRRKRWVVYAKGEYDASFVAPNWHRWLHHSTDELPKSNDSRYRWEKPPQQNMTGTSVVLYPDAKLPSKEQMTLDYQPWIPPVPNKKASVR